MVIECKSGVDNDGRLISKDHCNQLLGSVSWFKKNYDHTCTYVPIIVEPVNRFQSEASPSADMRVIDDEKLRTLRAAIKAFGRSLASGSSYTIDTAIAAQLESHSFTAAKFVTTYTKSFTRQAS